jgi:hypothetical protein
MLNPTDFKCETRNGVFVCAANTYDSLALYRTLQDRLRAVSGTMAQYRNDVPKSLSTLEVDGRIGPTTALAAQVVLAAMHQLVPLPADLLPILSDTASGDEIITLVSQHADAVLTYIDQTLIAYPTILRPQVQVPPPAAKKPAISKAGWAAIGGGVLMIGGLLLVAGKTQKATDGRDDRSRFLPDPTDEELAQEAAEDEADEDDGDGDEGGGGDGTDDKDE